MKRWVVAGVIFKASKGKNNKFYTFYNTKTNLLFDSGENQPFYTDSEVTPTQSATRARKICINLFP